MIEGELMDIDSKKKINTLPNKMTVIRVAYIPFILVCLCFPGKLASFLAGTFFFMAAITDILDGYFARKYGSVTVLGKFLDPLADKLLVSMTMIMLIPLGRIPVWIVLIIITREMALTGLRGIAVTEGVVIQASKLGKYKTAFQSVSMVGLCLHYSYFGIDTHAIGMIFLWGALILTVWSGWDYFRRFKGVFLREP